MLMERFQLDLQALVSQAGCAGMPKPPLKWTLFLVRSSWISSRRPRPQAALSEPREVPVAQENQKRNNIVGAGLKKFQAPRP